MATTQISVRLEDSLTEQLDKFVDGIRYRSRAQIMVIALIDWLVKEGAGLSQYDRMNVPRQAEEEGAKQVIAERHFEAMLKDTLRKMVASGELPEALKPKKGKKR